MFSSIIPALMVMMNGNRQRMNMQMTQQRMRQQAQNTAMRLARNAQEKNRQDSEVEDKDADSNCE